MTTLTKSPLDLTAADVMSRQLLIIPRHMSLRTAAHMLSKAHVSGAPVTDEAGHCIGVLSRTDLMRWVGQGAETTKYAGVSCVCSDWQMLMLDEIPEDEVGQYMTTELVAADPDTRVGKLARWMLDAHIHRVVVLDGHRRPIGMVTTSDILAAVAQADAPTEFGE
jgi:CBS domain-containing membrane protein